MAMTGASDRLATADPHVLVTADEERIKLIALPDSRGRRHRPGGGYVARARTAFAEPFWLSDAESGPP
jgi:hypothetical protein